MIIVNIPQICSWYLFYDATTLNELFIANILLGYGSGFLKSPALSYIGEISEASVRGVLVATVSLSTMAGLLIAFLLGNLTAWRNVALICLIIRIIVMIAINIVCALSNSLDSYCFWSEINIISLGPRITNVVVNEKSRRSRFKVINMVTWMGSGLYGSNRIRDNEASQVICEFMFSMRESENRLHSSITINEWKIEISHSTTNVETPLHFGHL